MAVTKYRIPIYRVALVRERTVEHGQPCLNCPERVYSLINAYLADADREHFVVLMLDQKNKLIGINTVSIGSLTATVVHPREVYKPAILTNAAAIIVVHNHLSGDAEPSPEDITLTDRLVKAGETLGIHMLDHIIIGNSDYCSLRERRFIIPPK